MIPQSSSDSSSSDRIFNLVRPFDESDPHGELIKYAKTIKSLSGQPAQTDISCKLSCEKLINLSEKCDSWKNHAFLKLFCIGFTDSQTPQCKSKFYKDGSGKIIDWVSAQSRFHEGQIISWPILRKTDLINRRIIVRKSQIGSGHSEIAVIQEIKDNFDQIAENLKDIIDSFSEESVHYLFGFIIQSSFDMCENCKENIVEFYKSQKEGQTSLFQRICETELSDGRNVDEVISPENPANDFALIFQSQYPYKDSKYSALFNEKQYLFDYKYPQKAQPNKDTFAITKEDLEDFEAEFPAKYTFLSQNTSVDLKSGIYGYINEFGVEKIAYDNHKFTHSRH